MNTINLSAIVHASIIVKDTATSLRFYCDILNLPVDASRPDLGYPGAWFQIGEQQLHLLELPNPDPVSQRPEHGGHDRHDRHVAFHVADLEALQNAFDKHDIRYTLSKSGRKALFVRDPDGNALELIEAG